jgi:hypothetical protein
VGTLDAAAGNESTAPVAVSITRAPTGELYVASTAGLQRSEDCGATWTRVGGPSEELITSVCIVDTQLHALDAFGRIWRLDDLEADRKAR